ncbi:MAG TPA: deoxyguanosinetriphosphate triphosphohydrolase [Verrucomicrobiae bacterium]|nr:deoxyguanosinetriphosphate triphosphohydrolase [Verrucomicrobiae bacterium]
MARDRIELEQFEYKTLAPYAQKAADSRGRAFPEPKHALRTDFQRDRDRIIHSRAFRRLEYKTQVFLNGTGDHLRTRLTHTIEVAGVSRGIARALRLNEDLAESIALAHDLGHPPFGHAGEEMLDKLMKDHGGFEHNLQSLRVVTELEEKYPAFNGLNLTWETREGLAKHYTQFDKPAHLKEFDFQSSSLEAQIANLADEVTYYSHDIDDGVDSGLITLDQLREVAIWQTTFERVSREHPGIDRARMREFTIRELIEREVGDVIATSDTNISAAKVTSADDVRRRSGPLISYSKELQQANKELRDFLYTNLYFNPIKHMPHQRAVEALSELFRAYAANPRLMGESTQRRLGEVGLHRAICDYIAGMTDRFALEEYQRICGPAKSA